jgi:hypothetical protein
MRDLYEIELHMHGDVIKKHLEAMKAELDALPQLGPYGITVEYDIKWAIEDFLNALQGGLNVQSGIEDETSDQEADRENAQEEFCESLFEWLKRLFAPRPIGQAAFLAGIVKQELRGKL